MVAEFRDIQPRDIVPPDIALPRIQGPGSSDSHLFRIQQLDGEVSHGPPGREPTLKKDIKPQYCTCLGRRLLLAEY